MNRIPFFPFFSEMHHQSRRFVTSSWLLVLGALLSGSIVSAQPVSYTGSAGTNNWMSAGNWSPTGVPTGTGMARFLSAPQAPGEVGIDMGAAGGALAIGVIIVDPTRLTPLVLGNSSAVAGVFTFNGGTVDLTNAVLSHKSSQPLTIQQNVGGGTGGMTMALGSATDNVIDLGSAGVVNISIPITGSDRVLFQFGGPSSVLNLTGANTYTGLTTVDGGTLRLNRPGGTTLPTTNNVRVRGGTFRVSTDQTLNDLSATGGMATKVTIDAGATLTITGTLMNVADITNNGTLQINGTFSNYGKITNNGTVQINGTLEVLPGGVFLNNGPNYGTSSLLQYSGSGGVYRSGEWGTSSSGPGCPNNVRISNALLNYANGSTAARFIRGNLTVDPGSSLHMDDGSVALTNPLTVNGTVRLDGSLLLGGGVGGDIKVGGDWLEGPDVLFGPNNRALILFGTAPQIIARNSGAGTNTFDYLRLEKTGGHVSLRNNVTLRKGLVFAASNTANIDATLGTLIVDNSPDLTASAVDRSGGGHVIGNLRRSIATGANSYFFPVGTNEGYTPVRLNFGSAGTFGYLTVSSSNNNHPNLATYGLNATKYLSRYWNVTNSGVAGFTASATFQYLAGDLQGGVTAAELKLAKYDASWTYPTTTTGANTITGSGITSFSDFTAGACGTVTATASSNTPACSGNLNLNATASGTGPFTYSWTGPNGFSSAQKDPVITAVGVNATGTYSVTVTNAIGCSASSSTAVVVPCQAIFSGSVLWTRNHAVGVKDVTVSLTGSQTASVVTPLAGTYSITVSPGATFTITPTKSLGLLNGVSAGDAQRILSLLAPTNPNAPTDPYDLVAADVNISNTITSLDANIIQAALLGNTQALAQWTKSWRFVPTSHTMSNPPWGFPEKVTLTGGAANVNFYAIKVGDVAIAHANPANGGAGSPLVLRVKDQAVEAGQNIQVDVDADALSDIAALQLALRFAPSHLRLSSLTAADGLSLTADNFGLYEVESGYVRLVWAGTEAVSIKQQRRIFRLDFEVLAGGARLSELLSLAHEVLPGHVYNSAQEESDVRLRFDASTATGAPLGEESVRLFQNRPNPFAHQTSIGFVLPAACEVRLRVMDAGGRVVAERSGHYPAGRHEEPFEWDGAAGLLYYELVTPYGVLVRKMEKL